jgi:hypothetical protein
VAVPYHHRAFHDAYGDGPHRCYICGEIVNVKWLPFAAPHGQRFKSIDGTRYAIHHVDEDDSNNEPENLRMIHQGCHVRIHPFYSRKCQPGCTCKRHDSEEHRRAALVHRKVKV